MARYKYDKEMNLYSLNRKPIVLFSTVFPKNTTLL